MRDVEDAVPYIRYADTLTCSFVGGDAHIAPPWEIAFRRRDTRVPPYRVYVSGRTGSSVVMEYLPVPAR